MAGRYYRGREAARQWYDLLRGQMLGALPGDIAHISQGLWEQQQPIFEEMFRNYMGGAAGLGQAVPGQGMSSAGLRGLTDLQSQFIADITGQAMGAALMPWQAQFGGAPDAMQQSRLLAQKMGQQTGAFTGGMQAVGGTCCFIFAEANNGVLDRIARRYRDEHGTLEQAIGYKFLSLLLVPLMRNFKFIKSLVRWTMVKPMIWWGKAFYKKNKSGHIFYPIARGWLELYAALGRKLLTGRYKNARRSNV